MTSNPFPSIYYVYEHFHPETFEIVYIGYGSKGRAWTCGHKGLSIRTEKHLNWIETLLEFGYTPDQFVRVLRRGLSKNDAKEYELKLIHAFKPVFNKSIRYPGLKFTPELYKKAIGMREEGMSYKAIGERLSLATMTIHRGLSGKSISLETALADQG